MNNYGDLKTAIKDHLHRDDLSGSTLSTIVTLGNTRINRDVRSVDMLTRTTMAVDEEYESLPTGWLEFKSLAAISSGGVRPLGQLSTEQMDKMFMTSDTGLMLYYSIMGREIRFQPVPESSTNVRVLYFQGIPTWADDTDTHALLLTNPGLFLAASMLEAMIYTEDNPSTWAATYKDAVNQENLRTKQSEYSGSSLQIKTMGMSTP